MTDQNRHNPSSDSNGISTSTTKYNNANSSNNYAINMNERSAVTDVFGGSYPTHCTLWGKIGPELLKTKNRVNCDFWWIWVFFMILYDVGYHRKVEIHVFFKKMTIWGEFKFYFLKNDHFGPFFGQIWPPNTPKSPKFRKSALTRLKHTCLWTLWRWWQVSGTSGIFRHLDFHEKSLNLVKLHRVPPVKFFFLKIFWIFFLFFRKSFKKHSTKLCR